MCVNISHQWVNQPLLRNHLCNLDKYYTHARAHTQKQQQQTYVAITITKYMTGKKWLKERNGAELSPINNLSIC